MTHPVLSRSVDHRLPSRRTACLLVLGFCAAPVLSRAETAPAAARGAATPKIRLTQDTVHKYLGGFGREFEVGLWAGEYVLEAEDAQGKHFLATRPSVWWKAGKSYLLLKAAGLWIPNDSGKDVRIYFYNEAGHVTAASLDELRTKVDALAKASVNSGEAGDRAVWDLAARQADQFPALLTARGIVATSLAVTVIEVLISAGMQGPQIHPAPPSPEFSRAVRDRLELV